MTPIIQALIVMFWIFFGLVVFIVVLGLLEGCIKRTITHYYSTKVAFLQKVQDMATEMYDQMQATQPDKTFAQWLEDLGAKTRKEE